LFAAADPHACTIFVQSRPPHAQLTWLLESTVYDGELRQMINTRRRPAARLPGASSLLTYQH
jgi:tryptophanyl-tRNA synthetase